MEDDFIKDIEQWLEKLGWQGTEIPKELHSAYEEGPFSKCIGCSKKILQTNELYEIQKVLRSREVIFEYALCMECGEALVSEYSKESLEALQGYFIEHYIPSNEMDHCHLCQRESHSFADYSLVAMCKGQSMVSICMICSTCQENMQELVSEKTRKTMGDFVDNKFPGVPAEFNPMPMLK